MNTIQNTIQPRLTQWESVANTTSSSGSAATQGAITIALAEGQGLVRSALKAMLQPPRFNVVAEAQDGLEAVAIVRREKPDVLLLNLDLPRLHGAEVLRHLAEQTHTKTIALSPALNSWKLAEAIKGGAIGLLTFDCSAAELELAIRTVASGEQYSQECIQKRAVGDIFGSDRRNPLTQREHMVLELAAQGLASSEIGQRLFISRRTAEAHRANLMRKLRLKSQTDLVLYAVRAGIVAA